jgi:hypothetical protein
MVTAQGYPFYWKALLGNTQAVTTVTDLVAMLGSDSCETAEKTICGIEAMHMI